VRIENPATLRVSAARLTEPDLLDLEPDLLDLDLDLLNLLDLDLDLDLDFLNLLDLAPAAPLGLA
jgi:hypothetical protein